VDLFYQDYSSAPTYPILCGSKLPGDFGEVFVPGTSMTELFDTEGSETSASAATNGTGAGGGGGMTRSGSYSQLGGGGATASKLGAESEHHQALLEYKLVLMNKQENLGLGLGHVVRRKYGNPVPIKTVGNKGSVELRGPAAVVLPSTARKVAQGLMGAAGAVATVGTAVPAAAVNRLQQGLRGTPEKKALYKSNSTNGANVISTEPGTMLVRLSSANTPRDRQTRRTSTLRSTSSLGDHHHHSTPPPKPVDDQDALEAFEAMQQVPAIIPTSAPGGGGGGTGGTGGGVDNAEIAGVGSARGGGIPDVLATSKSGHVADEDVFTSEEAATEAVLQTEAAVGGGTPQLNRVTSTDHSARNKLLQPLEGEVSEYTGQMVEEQGKKIQRDHSNNHQFIQNSLFTHQLIFYPFSLIFLQSNGSGLSRSRAKASAFLSSLLTSLQLLLIPSTPTPSSSP
jgi:hypothetical protein